MCGLQKNPAVTTPTVSCFETVGEQVLRHRTATKKWRPTAARFRCWCGRLHGAEQPCGCPLPQLDRQVPRLAGGAAVHLDRLLLGPRGTSDGGLADKNWWPSNFRLGMLATLAEFARVALVRVHSERE